MPRKPRIRAQGLYHHVVHRGINRQRIFFDDIDKRRFLNSLSDAAQRCGLDVLAYCLTDNHYHLLFWDPNAQISRVMALINGSYTSYINRRHKRDGALLRGRFYSNPSDESRYALCVLRYIHLNPVTALGSDPFALWSLPLGLAFDHPDSARPLAMTHRTFTIWILCLILFSRPKSKCTRLPCR